MASYTTNLNLKKPAGSENVSIGDINANMDAIDAAVGNSVKKTGNESIGGDKSFTGAVAVKNSTTMPSIRMMGTDLANPCGIIYLRDAETNGNYGQAYFAFLEYVPDANNPANRGGYERYDLPVPDAGITGSNMYKILTTKTAPTFKSFTLSSGDNTFTVSNSSRIRIDFVFAQTAREGTALVATGSTGTFYIKSDLGSNLTMSGSSGTLTISVTGGGTAMYCMVYTGDINEAST